MAEVNIFIRTADQTRKAEVAMQSTQTGADVIQAAVDNWALPRDTDYSLVNTRTAQAVQPLNTLERQGVQDGDMLEVQPVLVAGKL